ncbi:hypothetical protein ACE5IS_09890 [Leptospira wolffii]|uniref:Uncharacterized protein n=1 Tax=Leptospira wolffii TaxID=409998 RepID=A0A2M9ZE40_9LEPT|nr:hypothetical protein [Leptospira wolffii]EPG64982.1 hypothetical protein LEP1GSC061_2590 [Leptospira wolffii serovar Khorat str. Khorat-H2]PJZ66679.1 hypothetical protein CH371_00795 [Leptospira wolffii]TGK61654.1 hypothetical protein EHQ32_02015 [Leptospira wolffii]TGK70198.1 hypothetical protein EHQ35_17430 [Leptospira wolffii]TGK77121.1 hypothetical protein EHQ27_03880 [Leptospira wolffii]
MAKKSDSKKELLKKAAGDAVRKSLSGEVSKSKEPVREEPSLRENRPSEPRRNVAEPSPASEGEKQLPKKEPLFKVHNSMRIEEYTQNGLRESNGNKKWIRIFGVVLFVLLVWWIWPSKHEIYMDVEKMSPEKVSSMSSEKEYHFAHGQEFFIYYKRGGWFSPDKLKLTIYKTDDNKAEISVQEKESKRRIEKWQTYYDDSFFDDEGTYEVEIKNEDDEVLVTKKFTID